MPEVDKYSLRSNTVYWWLSGHSSALRDSILSTRGWALQEQLLARRIIHFTDSEMIWECSSGLQSESGRTGYLQLMDLMRLLTNGNAARLPKVRRDTGEERVDQNINNFLQAEATDSVYWVWRQIVTDYSRRALTRAEDKLIALSGIAKVFASRLSINPEDSYFAGLWKDALIRDLLWKVNKPANAACGGAERTHIAPSWSWASISGAVHYFFSEYQFKFEPLAEVFDVSCVRTSTDPTGAVAGGSLKITAQFQSAVLEVKPPSSSTATPSRTLHYTGNHTLRQRRHTLWPRKQTARPQKPPGPTAHCGWRPATRAFVSGHEPGEDEVGVFLDEPLEDGVYTQGYQCLVLGANVDRFSGARRTWFLVVKQKSTRESDGLRVVERTGIGFTSSTDSWLLDSDFETIVVV